MQSVSILNACNRQYIFKELTPAATCASYQYCSSGLSAVMAKSANIAVKAVK